MKKLLFLLLLVPFLSFSQNTIGTIISEKTGYPVSDANITNLNTKSKTLSNSKGEFILNATNENDTLQISHIGFIERKITFKELKKQKYRVALFEEVENLKELTLTANHQLKLKDKLAFEKLTSLKYGISSFGSFLLDGKIYVSGGDSSMEFDINQRMRDLNVSDQDYLKRLIQEKRSDFSSNLFNDKLQVYDIKNNTWEISNIKLKNRAYHSLNYYDGKFYILGGKRPSLNGRFEYLNDEIEVYDIQNQTVKIDKTNPHQAINFASFTYQDNIIVMGGSISMTEKGKKTFSDKVHFYNIKSGYWYELPKMSTPKETSGILVDNTIYLFGGNNGNDLDTIETFDLNSEKWATLGTLFYAVEKPAVTSHNNVIYLFDNNSITVFDIKNKTMKQFSVEINTVNASIHYYNNKLYIVGGIKENNYSKTPSRGTFSINLEEFETTKYEKIKTLKDALAIKS